MIEATQYSRTMLPILGVTWTAFPTMREAIRFAKWAEQTTAQDEHPCDAFVDHDEQAPADERYLVCVRNW